MKKVVSLFMVVAMLVGMCFAFASCGGEKKNDEFTIKIGVSGPLSGGAALYGKAVFNGASMAIEELNAKGGLFGHKLELLSYDDQHKPELVEVGYAELVEKGMLVSLGCVTSAPCAEFAAFSKEDNMFFLTPSASNDDVPAESNGYQMCFADGNQGGAAAQYVNGLVAAGKVKSVGILYLSGDNYSTGIYNQFKAGLDSTITTVDAPFVQGTEDFSSQVGKLKDCDFVFMPIYYQDAAKFMLAAKSVENAMEVFYGCDGLDGIAEHLGDQLSTIPQEISYLSHFNAKSDDATTKTFVEKYKAKYNEEPIQFGASAYDCVYALYQAMEQLGEDKVNENTSSSDLCDELANLFDNGFTFSGVTGSNMTWTRKTSGKGYVSKVPTSYPVKESSLNK